MKSKQGKQVFVIAIAGGTGSGKTYVAKKLAMLDPHRIAMITHDNYYKDQSQVAASQRKFLNYDYPGALDNQLFLEQLKALKRGEAIELPQYSFKTHSRLSETVPMSPMPVIIVEGILVLSNAALRKLYDLVVFIDVDDDIRLARRLTRDVGERDRDMAESLRQYLGSAQPMHDLYVKPGMEHSDIIINNNGDQAELDKSIEVVKARIMEVLGICPKVESWASNIKKPEKISVE